MYRHRSHIRKPGELPPADLLPDRPWICLPCSWAGPRQANFNLQEHHSVGFPRFPCDSQVYTGGNMTFRSSPCSIPNARQV